MNDSTGGEGLGGIVESIKLQARWAELEPYRTAKTENYIARAITQVKKKLDQTRVFISKEPDGVLVPSSVIVARIYRDIVLALSTNTELNEDYAQLLLRVVSGIKYGLSPEEKNLAFLDVCLLNEIVVHNNIVAAHGGDPVLDISGLKYFWDFFAEPDERGWTSSARFCAFIGEVAHASKDGRGSDRGFLETINIMALRHGRGEETFLSLDVGKMLSSVDW